MTFLATRGYLGSVYLVSSAGYSSSIDLTPHLWKMPERTLRSVTDFDEAIDGFAQGDAFEIPRTILVSDILPDTLSKAWFTVKRRQTDSDANAIFQKVITPTLASDGHIDEVGSDDENGHLYFIVTSTDTRSMAADIRYFYEVKVLSSGGYPKRMEEGRIMARAGVTQTES